MVRVLFLSQDENVEELKKKVKKIKKKNKNKISESLNTKVPN